VRLVSVVSRNLMRFRCRTLERDELMCGHLTDLSRLLARHASCRGLVDHKRSITTSRKRDKPALSCRRRASCTKVGQIRPSGALQRLPDAPHRAAHCACHMDEFCSIKRPHINSSRSNPDQPGTGQGRCLFPQNLIQASNNAHLSVGRIRVWLYIFASGSD